MSPIGLPQTADIETVEVFIGRQPILDRKQNIAGYELLFRSSHENSCNEPDAVAATASVLGAILSFGIDNLLGGKPAFINFDRTLLLGDWTTLLSPKTTVIEILETVPPDPEVLAACEALQKQGYVLAVDDCIDDERTAAFAPWVDILKIDFQQLSAASQVQIFQRYRHLKVKMLAEKVETEEEFERALELGYHYFQGYFFEHPTIFQSERIPPSQLSSLRLLRLVQEPDLDYAAIEEAIRLDLSFSHALLRYLNSAAFTGAHRVESIRQALRLLGSDQVRKWVCMASLSSLGERRPPVLIQQALLRGRFCEFIAQSANLSLGEADPFLLGILSLLDAVLRRPLAIVLPDLHIAQSLGRALVDPLDEANPLSRLLHLVKCYEAGNWEEVGRSLKVMNLPLDRLVDGYRDSLAWVNKSLDTD